MKMNKKGEESDGGSITGVVGYLIILVALLVFVVLQTTSSGKVKDVGEELFNLDEIKKIAEEELTDEQKLELAEMRKVSSMLKEKIDSDGRDCIIPLDFSEYNEDFVINFFRNSGRGFLGVTKEHADFDAREPLLSNVYFNSLSNEHFAINKFRNLIFNGDSYDLGEDVFIYKAPNGDVYFMDYFKTALSRGFFSDILRKNVCGNEDAFNKLIITNANFDVVEGTTLEEAKDILEYLNSDFSYNGGTYKIYEILRYLLDLDGQRERGDFPIQEEINSLLNKLGEHVETYFGEEYRGLPIRSENKCWVASVDMGNVFDTITFGKSQGRNLLYRDSSVQLSDGSVINIRLSVSGENCLPAIEIDKLLEPYRSVGAPEGQ